MNESIVSSTRVSFLRTLLVLAFLSSTSVAVAGPAVQIDSPMSPPPWALAQRALLKANYDAAVVATEKYIDVRGWARITPNWGAMDGPDDVTEAFRHWPVLYMLGGPRELYDMHKKIWNGHIEQFTEAREPLVEVAKDGMYHKDFVVSLDWEHTGEAMAQWFWGGLTNDEDGQYLIRARRFAGLYMDEDPEARNYDPKHKIIRSLFNGSRGPHLGATTEAHWGGPPRPRHDPRPGQVHRSQRWTRLGYLVTLSGDHPQNMVTTHLALTAYMLTGEQKYRDWILEYVDAWVDRARQNGGNLPSNIGLDGTIGGEWDGKWWGGVYGWDFRPKNDDGTDNPGNCYIMRGARAGFGIAYLLTGDQKYIDTYRTQIDNLYAQGKMIDGVLQLPHKYGDDGWYGYEPKPETGGVGGNSNLWSLPELADIYLFTLKSSDLPRLNDDPWVQYLNGKDDGFPLRAMAYDHELIREGVERIHEDSKSTSTRASSELTDPTAIFSLLNLMIGAAYPGGGGNALHAQVRYFDPEERRPGLPPDVAALVDKIRPSGVSLTLVNTDPVSRRKLIVQTGTYAEHNAVSVTVDGRRVAVGDSHFEVWLQPGAGARITIEMDRYANQPTLKFPWNR